MPATVAAFHETTPRSTALNVSLWTAQLVLFAMFALAGVMKSTQPIATLSQTITWAAELPVALVRLIGVSELAGAIGILLPSLTRIKPGLTPLAALGLAVVMLLALGFHIMRGEMNMLGMPILLGALAAFVAWGRSRRAPIKARN